MIKTEKQHNPTELPIAVFDSGVGGISVLKALVGYMPEEDYIYFGDAYNAPYGTKTLEQVRELTVRNIDLLTEQGVKAVVIACNTATSAAIQILRDRYPSIPVIGIEPALKPAVKLSNPKRVIVMATPMTLREEKFQNLMEEYQKESEIIKLPCPGLMEFIERGDLHSEELKSYLTELFAPHVQEQIGGVVLGCTHYPFVKKMLSLVLGESVALYEGGPGTARETCRRLTENGVKREKGRTGIVIFEHTKMPAATVEICKQLLEAEM